MQVVCDTNIWYGFANGDLDADKLPDSVELIATYSNLYELAKSHKLYTSPLEVKEATQALLRYAKDFELLQPLPYIQALEQSGSEPDVQQGMYLLGELRKFTEMDGLFIEKEMPKRREEARDIVIEHTRDLENTNDAINNELLPQVRERIKQTSGKHQHRLRDNSGELRDLLRDCVRSETGYTLSEHFDWRKLELMMGVWGLFFKDLEVSKMKIRTNDWYDFFNMVYVNPTRRYWTHENKWQSYAEEAGLSKYLFEPVR